MIRIIIVDDEAIEREALKAMIERGVKGIQVVGQAENGEHAVELASELEPDLMLMDIQMPGIHWYEAIQQIQAKQPSVKFVIVTAYDMFDYARQALRLGVKDYLLKPSKFRTIVDTIQQVTTEIEQEKKREGRREEERQTLQKLRPIMEADLVVQLLYDHVHEIQLKEILDLMPLGESTAFFVMVVNIVPGDQRLHNQSEAQMKAPGLEEMYKLIKEQIRNAENAWIGPMSAWQIPVIILRDDKQTYRSQAVSLARKLTQLSLRFKAYRLFIGIGNLCCRLEEIRNSYHEALLACGNLDLPAKICFYEEADSSPEGQSVIADVEKRMLEEAKRGNWGNVEHELLQVIMKYEAAGRMVISAQQKVFELLFILSRLLWEMGVETDQRNVFAQKLTYPQLKAQVKACVQALSEAYLAVKNRLEPDLMMNVKHFILANAHEDISLETISEQARLSPFYVSKLFKEQFGMNYIEYLTECRIEKAKRLLVDPNKSLKEIAFEVGYHDPNYFSRVFKKMTELSPSDYRKELIMQKR